MSDITLPREQRLVSVLGRASGRLRLRFTERWLFVLGGALVVAGIVSVIVGYVGTSRTVLVSGQIPYVVSGGLLGVALVFVGGFLYFGHWMAMLVRESRERGAEDRNDLTRLYDGLGELTESVAALAGLLAASGGTTRSRSRSAARQSGSRPAPEEEVPLLRANRLVATPSGTMMHRPGCATVAGRSDLRTVTVDDGLKACGICRPLDGD